MVVIFVEYYDHTLVDLGLVSKAHCNKHQSLVAPSVEHQRQIQACVSIVVTFQDNGDSHMRLWLAQREAFTTESSQTYHSSRGAGSLEQIECSAYYEVCCKHAPYSICLSKTRKL